MDQPNQVGHDSVGPFLAPSGLKENVIVGRLIPGGTGLAYHQERRQKRQESVTEEKKFDELVFSATASEGESPEEPVAEAIGV